MPSQLSFLLQLAYFKAKQRFFSFTFGEVEEDVNYLLDHFFPRSNRAPLTTVSKPTLLKQHDVILNLCRYQLCTVTDRQHLAQRAQQAARISSKPVYIFRELLQYLIEQRLVAPGYTVLQDIVGQALTVEVQRLTMIIQTQLEADDCAALDHLFADSQGLYTITRLKKAPTDFSLGEMRREIARGEELRPLYHLATRVLPHLAISNEGINYSDLLQCDDPVTVVGLQRSKRRRQRHWADYAGVARRLAAYQLLWAVRVYQGDRSDQRGGDRGSACPAATHAFGGKTLAPGSLRMVPPEIISSNTLSPGPRIQPGLYIIDDGSAVVVAQAAVGAGTGRYTFGPTILTLTVPASAYARTYQSNVTVSIVSGP